jgi:hypothetical protein
VVDIKYLLDMNIAFCKDWRRLALLGAFGSTSPCEVPASLSKWAQNYIVFERSLNCSDVIETSDRDLT